METLAWRSHAPETASGARPCQNVLCTNRPLESQDTASHKGEEAEESKEGKIARRLRELRLGHESHFGDARGRRRWRTRNFGFLTGRRQKRQLGRLCILQ